MDPHGSSIRRLLSVCLLAALGTAGCSDSSGPIRRLDGIDTGTAYDVAITDGYAFVADNRGVDIISVDDPRGVAPTGVITLDEAAFAVHVDGTLALVGGGGAALWIVDIADPSHPVMLGTVNGQAAQGICTRSGVAYIGGLDGELAVIDISDPEAPHRLGGLTGLGGIRDLWCEGDLVYAAVPDDGVRVVDVSDPGSPVLVSTTSGTRGALDFDVDGTLLYLACHGDGARILDISDAAAPRVLSAFGRTGEAWGLAAAGGVLWLADLQEGVEVYDVVDPQHPALLYADDRFAPHDLEFDGNVAYLADQDDGFVVLAVDQDG
jgi:hypothetical protein